MRRTTDQIELACGVSVLAMLDLILEDENLHELSELQNGGKRISFHVQDRVKPRL